ncbi:aspartate aminotransferase, cytoplasmic-like [Ostrea edulis]|uniref:aspartate aminotransferase, cytoplasmic-like n=1 Tax=Ostrea edulis TaxID=37623 RepID=UPI0024AFEE26|nr:aspartate aminotransferase, cytoplasmic-like [Ostrea edulis]
MASVFGDIEIAPPIEVFNLTAQYTEDTHPHKVNLGVGAYRTDEGKPWVLPVVRTVEAQMATDSTLNHEYLPVAGMPDFRNAALKLLLGEDSPALVENRVEGVQAIGGTGAIRLCADFCKKMLGYDSMYTSSPTWGNHLGIFKSCGYSNVKQYRYWDAQNRTIDFNGMKEDLMAAPEKTVVIFHGCCHNPTGVNPTEEQWKEIADLVEKKKFMLLLDEAYQGFASGNLEQDGQVARYFVKRGFEFFVSQSFSKNFGLYNERTGNLVIVCANKDAKLRVKSQMEMVVRTTWSNSPNHGARIVASVLNNPAYYAEWKEHVKTMADRIKMMREMLFQKLKSLGTPGKWDHIIEQKGMFSFTGLNPAQVDVLIKKYHIYLLKNGRINMCALTTGNLEYVANAIHSAITECKL